jgi:hypothetical protein
MSSEALRLADWLENEMFPPELKIHAQAASLLRTQAARIAELEAELTSMTDSAGHLAVHSAELEAKLAEEDARTTRICGLLGASNAERDQLRAEVERLRKPLTDEPLQVAAALRRLVVSHAHEFGDTFYFGYVANILEACPVCHGSGFDFDDDLKDCAACQGSGKRAIEAAKED